jgi:hypothetical protein
MVRIKKSWVWNYLTENGNNTAICIFCKQELKTQYGTSTLSYHFKNLHKDKISSSIPTTPAKHKLKMEPKQCFTLSGAQCFKAP